MKTDCTMKQLLQELLQDQTDNHPIRNHEISHECCAILFTKYLISTKEALE